MRLNLESAELLLYQNQPLSVINGKGTVIRCLEGIAWLTVAKVAKDCFLKRGQEFRLETDSLALIEPMGEQVAIRLIATQSSRGGLIQRIVGLTG